MAAKPHIYAGADEIVSALRAHERDLAKWFAKPKQSIETIVKESVSGNTFRAFRNLPVKPSEVYRSWALKKCDSDNALAKAASCATQSDFDEWLRAFADDLQGEWQKKTSRPLDYGASRKLCNLLLKHFAWWAKYTTSEQARLVGHLHVALDEYTLCGIKRIMPHLKIPAKPTMKFVATEEMYDEIQHEIRRIASTAQKPPVYFDLLAWNVAHDYWPK
jgi:hypothetical protein